MIVEIAKKFLNSTIGTRDGKPLDIILKENFENIKNSMLIGRFTGVSSYTQTGIITGKLEYLTQYELNSTATIKDSYEYYYWVDRVDCIMSATTVEGAKLLIKPVVEIDKMNNKFIIRFLDNTINNPRTSGNIYYTLTYTTQRRKK